MAFDSVRAFFLVWAGGEGGGGVNASQAGFHIQSACATRFWLENIGACHVDIDFLFVAACCLLLNGAAAAAKKKMVCGGGHKTSLRNKVLSAAPGGCPYSA